MTNPKGTLKAHLHACFPAFRYARWADRTWRKTGQADRYIWLWESKERFKTLGRCQATTMTLFIEAGLWMHLSDAWFADYQDTAYEYWRAVEDS